MIATAIDASAKDVKRPVRADFAGISSGSRPRAARARGETCWKMTFELFRGAQLPEPSVFGTPGFPERSVSESSVSESSTLRALGFRKARRFGALSFSEGSARQAVAFAVEVAE